MGKIDKFIIDDTTYEIVPEIAPLFDPATPYYVDDCVIHDAVLYKFTANHAAGAWTGNDVVTFEVGSELVRLGNGSGLTESIKTALLACFEKVAWIDEDGQDYYDTLYGALYAVTAVILNANSIGISSIGGTSQLTAVTVPAGANVRWVSSDSSIATVSDSGLVTSVSYGSCTVTAIAGNVSATCRVLVSSASLIGITAVYTQTEEIYDGSSLDRLKTDLVVTASWSDSTTSEVASTDYTLSGVLEIGVSTITVSYGGQTDTFDVNVTAEEWSVTREIGNNYITGRVNQGSGSIDTSQTGWYTSDFISIPEGTTSYSRITSREADQYLVWYDSEQAYIGNGAGGTVSDNATYGGAYTYNNILWNVVPVTARYCKVSWRTAQTYTSITFARNKILDEYTTPVTDKLYAYTYNSTATGNSFNNDDFMKCSGMPYVHIRPIQQRSVTFYDEDFIVVSTVTRASNIGNNISIPSNAVYLKCQCSNVYSTNASATTKIGTGLIMFSDTTKESW